MPEETENKSGRYLYAIISGSDHHDYGSLGIQGGSVYTIPDGQVSAVVSDVPNKRIRPERRHLAAHQEVLKRLMEDITPLPMRFGMIADGPEAIERIISANRQSLLGQTRRVAGKLEMGLRVTWDVPNIFEYFVNTSPELRSARDRLIGGHREPTQEDKIELGRMFERILSEDRESLAERVEEVQSRSCAEIKRNPCREEREVMNLACLVKREARSQFEAGVFEAANLFDSNFSFDYNGPWAPHNFVEMDLEF